MFAYIKGSLEVKTKGYIVIDIGGVGYKIFMSETAISRLGDIGEIVKVHTYLKVKEDEMSLYGFNTNEELRMFELLLSVSGVGAKTAISILSNIEPSSFALAVITNDVNKIKSLPGIGPKGAQRIILELKDKIETDEAVSAEDSLDVKSVAVNTENVNEAISALQVLGYSRKEIEKSLEKADGNMSVEELIKYGLKNLSR
ncbi:MAG: Holliday junction branch migration protein RuvA [Clostridia bacterium]|nr:Holliday junction branch migration protein RuvA [Clostridia bacterium]